MFYYHALDHKVMELVFFFYNTFNRLDKVLYVDDCINLLLTHYLNTTNPSKNACMKNPRPIVIICNMSLTIKARINNNNKPPHANITTSSEGSLSDIPSINDSTEGIVAQWINTTANHPIASDDKCENLSRTIFLKVFVAPD